MPNYQISANLNAQITGFRQGMTDATRASGQAATAIDGNLQRVDRSAQRAGRSIQAAGQAARGSAPNYLELGRVLQDLPFGIAGIQNNLTQLIPSVGLAGLAFSAIVSAITFAQVGTSAWTRGLKDNKTAIDDAKLSGDDYIKTLKDVAGAQLKGAQNAQEEVVKLRSLYQIANDVTVSLSQRRDAVNALQKQYPEYFKNISDEAIMAGRAKSAYDALASSIIATGRARAAESKITENSIRQLEDEQKIADLNAQLLKTAGDAAKMRAKAEDQLGSQREFTLNKAIVIETQRRDIQTQINNLKTDSNILDKRNLELTKSITAEVKKGADIANYTADKVAKGKMFNRTDIGDAAMPKDLMDPTYAFRQAEGFRELLRSLTAYQSGIKAIEGDLTASQTRMIENAVKFNEQFAEITNNGFKEAIGGLGEALGSALSEGGNVFMAIGQSLLQSLGGVLVQLGEMAIGIGVGLTAIKASLESLNPVLAIAAGVALVALGSFFKGKAAGIGGGIKGGSNVTAFANGGIVSGPTNALIGEYSGARNNPEVVAPLNKLKGMLGNNTPNIYAEFSVSSKQLALVVRDGNNKLNRS